MPAWKPDELAAVARSRELTISPIGPDGSLGKPTRLWVVGVDAGVYVRASEGPAEPWFRSALERGRGRVEAGGVARDVVFGTVDRPLQGRIDAAYRRKYLGCARAVFRLTSAEARAATLELLAA
jgi:hypothetical protein